MVIDREKTGQGRGHGGARVVQRITDADRDEGRLGGLHPKRVDVRAAAHDAVELGDMGPRRVPSVGGAIGNRPDEVTQLLEARHLAAQAIKRDAVGDKPMHSQPLAELCRRRPAGVRERAEQLVVERGLGREAGGGGNGAHQVPVTISQALTSYICEPTIDVTNRSATFGYGATLRKGSQVMELALFALIFVAVGLASIVYGADSRFGIDHPQRRAI